MRGREASFWCAGRIARAGHPPWPAISEDGEPGSLAIYAQRDFRDSILAIIQNQIGYLLEFNFSYKNLNIPYRTRIAYLLEMLLQFKTERVGNIRKPRFAGVPFLG